MTRRPDANERALREGLASEFLGSAVRIDRHPGLARLPVEGTIVDETLGTFLVREPHRARLRRIPKSGAEGTIFLGERTLPLNGGALRVRPEDRTKRVLGGGRWSYP